jgi:hypothetical protein
MRCADRPPQCASARGVLHAALLLTMLSACRTTNAPRAYRIAPETLASRVTGSWVKVQHRDGSYTSGELLAAAGDTVFTVSGNALTLTAVNDISRVTVTRYGPDIGDLVVWTLLGTLSTASHGFGLILTAPAWIVTGIAATAAETHRAIVVTSDIAKLATWSRFPAGIPATVERDKLREAIPSATPP